MAVTVNVQGTIAEKDTSSEVWGTLDFDSSYPVGGETITITGHGAWSQIIAGSKGGYVFEQDVANQKLKAMYGDNNNASDGPLIEVPDTTSLATVTGVPFRAIVEN